MRSSAGHHRMINVSGHFRSLRCAKRPASVIIRGYLDASPPSPRQVRPRRSTMCIARPEDQRVRPFQVVPRRERAGNGDHRGESRPSAPSATQRVWRGVTAWLYAPSERRLLVKAGPPGQSGASWSERLAQVGTESRPGARASRTPTPIGRGRRRGCAELARSFAGASGDAADPAQTERPRQARPGATGRQPRHVPPTLSYRSRTTRPTAQSG